MTILDTLAAQLGYRKATPPLPPLLRAMAGAERWSVPEFALVQNQDELYQRLSWVAIAVQFIADAAQTQPLSVKRLEGEHSVDIPNHPMETLLRTPNPLAARFCAARSPTAR